MPEVDALTPDDVNLGRIEEVVSTYRGRVMVGKDLMELGI
jgi:hypothetical protein